MLLRPGQRYQLTLTAAPDPAVIERAQGAVQVARTALPYMVGKSLNVAADMDVFAVEPVEVTVTAGELHRWNGGTSALAGATAADRRIIDTTGVVAAPTLPTDGFSLEGADFLWIPVTVGAGLPGQTVDLTLWEFDDVSETWTQDGTFGTQTVAQGATVRLGGPTLTTRGLSRFAVAVPTNADSLQVDAWGILCEEA